MEAGRICIRFLRDFSCANVNFEAKPSKVVGWEGDSFFNVSPGFKDKCAVV